MIKNSKKTIIIILLLLLAVMGFLGLSGIPSNLFDGVLDIFDKSNTCGGVVNNKNLFAPKKIKSDNIVYFHTKFILEPRNEYERKYEESKYHPGEAKGYIFEIKTDKDEKVILLEDYYDPVSCETDKSIFLELQKIIEKYDLVKMNGISKYTQGLPPEFSPSYLEAIYDSGEKLYFCVDNDPYASWSRDMAHLLRSELANHGAIELPEQLRIKFKDKSDTKELIKGKTFYARLFKDYDYYEYYIYEKLGHDYKIKDFKDENFIIWLNYVTVSNFGEVVKKNDLAIPYTLNPNGNEEALKNLFYEFYNDLIMGEKIWKFTTDNDGKIIDAVFYKTYSSDDYSCDSQQQYEDR